MSCELTAADEARGGQAFFEKPNSILQALGRRWRPCLASKEGRHETSSVPAHGRPRPRHDGDRKSPAIAQSNPALKWRLTASWPKSIDIAYGTAETVARLVAEATDNQFQFNSSPPARSFPALQAMDAVSSGTVEACHTAAYYYFGKDPTFALFCAVPFELDQRQMFGWFNDGDGMTLMNELGKKFGVHSLVCGGTGCQMGGWFRREIKELADINGLKFRIGEFAAKTIQRLGGVPQQIAGGDIYSSLERGTIDAAEWVGPYDDEKLGFGRIANGSLLSGLVGGW